MPEEFKEYRRRTKQSTERKRRKKIFSKKLISQLLFSLIIFTLVFVVKRINTPFTNNIDVKLKDAFTYKIDTSGVTDAIDRILKNNPDKGEIPNETKDQQDSHAEDI